MLGSIIDCAGYHKFDKVLALLDLGIDPNQSDYIGDSSLHNTNKEIAVLLIKRGADVNIQSIDKMTPLHLAIIRNDFDLVQVLVENGANVNAKNQHGLTPLAIAVDRNYLKIVQYLVENGSDINSTNDFGQTPLHFAVYRGAYEIIKYLLSIGASKSVRDQYNHTPYCFASDKIRKIFDRYEVCRAFIDLWIMNNAEFTMFNQWLPEEMSDDVLSLILGYDTRVRSLF